MSEQKNSPAAAQPASPPVAEQAPAATLAATPVAPKTAPKKARPAAKPAAAKPVAAKAVAARSATPAAARPPRVRKPTEVEQTVAKHRKVLAEELVKAQAISYEQPKLMKQPEAAMKAPKKAGKATAKAAVKETAKAAAKENAKPAKVKKPRLVRDSYAMPEIEYAQIALLKKRLAALGREVKKSELLRGGIAALAAFNDDELKAVMGRIERIKTGRPAKK